MDENKHWKYFIPGWTPDSNVEDDRVNVLKDTIQYNLERQKEQLFTMVDAAVNLKLEDKNISEWRETAKYLSELAEQRLIAIERLNRPEPEVSNITLDGKSIIVWRKEAAYFRDVYEEARELAEKLQKEIDRLRQVVAEQSGKLNKQTQEIADAWILKGKDITEWEEIADSRLTEIRKLEKVITKQGEEIRTAWTTATREALRFERLQNIVAERGAKLNKQENEIAKLKAEKDSLRMDVSALNKKVGILHEAYKDKLDRVHESYHEAVMELRELRRKA